MLRLARWPISVGCGLVGVLIVVLWMRSYEDYQYFAIHLVPITFELKAAKGKLIVGTRLAASVLAGWSYETHTLAYSGLLMSNKDKFEIFLYINRNFDFFRTSTSLEILLPCWLGTAVAAALVPIPWLLGSPWRFSLRALLIATTLIGLILGVVVALTRR